MGGATARRAPAVASLKFKQEPAVHRAVKCAKGGWDGGWKDEPGGEPEKRSAFEKLQVGALLAFASSCAHRTQHATIARASASPCRPADAYRCDRQGILALSPCRRTTGGRVYSARPRHTTTKGPMESPCRVPRPLEITYRGVTTDGLIGAAQRSALMQAIWLVAGTSHGTGSRQHQLGACSCACVCANARAQQEIVMNGPL
jgi:hypothetical protein